MIPDSRTAELGGVAATEVPDSVELLARTYTHPMLDDRAVVRLVRVPLTEVEDLSLGVMGFEGAASAPVGHVRTKAIGFPAWPILHDPANARHALNLVGDLQRAAKLARSRPGPAKDMLDELASRLGASAPHFLPTFLEEAARIFLALDNRAYATQYFAKAREAERIHNLPIDETRHRQVLLEFALAGALSAKELTTESKALLERHSPEEALEQFIQLNIDRVKGGLPPYANLHTDTRRLVKAAKADQQQVDERLLDAMLRSPAVSKAPQAFWNAFMTPLARMAEHTPEMRDLLFALTPDGAKTAGWLQVLETAGILAEMRSGERDVLDWVDRFICKESRTWNSDFPAELSQFIRSLPSQEGRVLELPLHPRDTEPELIDAVLSRGCRVEMDHTHDWRNRFDLAGWLADDRRSDLTHLAASEHAPRAAAGLAEVKLGEHLEVLLAHEGSRQLLHRWATTSLTEDSTAPEFFTELERLRPLYTPAARAEVAGELARFESLADPAELTAKAIRDGLLTELTWPALEAAAAELGSDEADPDEVSVQESWPWFGVARRNRIIWTKGDERGADVTIDVPGAQKFSEWRWLLVAGDTACLSWDSSWSRHLTWASDPATHHKQEFHHWPSVDFGDFSLEVEAGRLRGPGLLRPSAAQFPTSGRATVFQEGSSHWSHEPWEQDPHALDPDTGKLGRESMPPGLAALVEADLRDGFCLESRQTQWMPAVPETLGSPLGVADGQHGWVLLTRDDDELLARGIDGFTWRGVTQHHGSSWPGAHVARPGGGHWLVVDGILHLENLAPLSIACSARGRAHLLHDLPVAGWHHLRVRDEAVSARMRTMQAADVAGLIAALPQWSHDEPESLPDAVVEAAEQLLGTTDPALSVAVGWLALRLNRATQRLQQLRDDSEGDTSRTFGQWMPSDKAVGWLPRGSVLTHEGFTRINRALDGQRWDRFVVTSKARTTLLHPELLLAGACTPLASPELIQGTAAAFGAIKDSGLHQPETVTFLVRYPDGLFVSDLEYGHRVETPTGPAVVLDSDYTRDDRVFFLLCPSGGIPAEVNKKATELVDRSSGIDLDAHTAAFEALLSSGGPAWEPGAAERLAEGTGWSLPTAKILLAGMPNLDSWEHNWLPKDLREFLGLKVAEAAAARTFLRGLPLELLVALVRAGVTDPMHVVHHGLDVDGIIACWKEHTAGSITLSEEIITEAGRVIAGGGSHGVKRLTEDGASLDQLPHWLWLASRLPLVDPLRPWLADRLEHMLATSLDREYEESIYSDTKDQIRTILGLPTFASTSKGTVQRVGPWTLTREEHSDQLAFDPAKVEDWELELQRARSMPADGFHRSRRIADLAAVAAGHYAPIQEWLRAPGDGWAADPLTSAPETLAEVQTTLDLPEDSARYWLQLLALHNPTDKNIDLWNGWKKTHRVKAAAPLLEKGLVIEAKRSRAGRSWFLPGGWMEARAPHLPLEVWKAPFYELEDTPKVNSRWYVVVPTVPLPRLFADAWQRFQGGDVPGYEELRTERYRRR
ncbi:hypothetical protein EII34_04505 [Arachnia propionica]|uniref:DNA-binding protein n=1 Tax=Arachnia propionica TaxID=1750 RepID=A0A3P1TBU9_9ACTN|nr:hypothetical protein [Arachnia propionica]RRD05953.1 hypothetical protein EII34_04505 [Arachnia propionica]